MPTLPEQLLLVALDERGRPGDPRSSLGPAMAGAVLTELLLRGRIALDGDNVRLTGTEQDGDPVLDRALERIREEDKPHKLRWWVQKLAGGPWHDDAARNQVIDELTDQGVLQRAGGKTLGLFEVTRHPAADPAAPEAARASVREVLSGVRAPDERMAALIALVEVTGLVDACVPREERKAARARAKAIAKGDEVSEAVRRIQEEVMAAVTAAVVAASAAGSSGSSGSS